MYHHTQLGKLVVGAVGVIVVASLAIGVLAEGHSVALGAAVFFAVLLLLFHSLTVDITDRRLIVRFGPGLVRKSFPIEAIREARAVRNRWYYGWGVRWTPHGWLFNVSGLDAVEIKLENGRQYRIGTDRPDELVAAIRAAGRLSPGDS